MIFRSGAMFRMERSSSRDGVAADGSCAGPRSNSTTSGSTRRTSASVCSDASLIVTSRSAKMLSSSRRSARSFSSIRSFRRSLSEFMTLIGVKAYSAGTLAHHDNFNRLQQDAQVEQQRVVLDVIEIVLELLQRILL